MTLFFLIECLVALVKLLMGKTDYHLLLESLQIAKLNVVSESIKAGMQTRQQHELDRVTGELRTKDAIRQARLADEASELAAIAERRRMREEHLASLKSSGVPEEEVNAERDRLAKAERKGRFKVFSGGRR